MKTPPGSSPERGLGTVKGVRQRRGEFPFHPGGVVEVQLEKRDGKTRRRLFDDVSRLARRVVVDLPHRAVRADDLFWRGGIRCLSCGSPNRSRWSTVP